MAVRYTKQSEKTGATVGTIVSVPKPSTWTDSTNLSTEGSNWNIETSHPGWMPCDGRTLNVSDYRALYAVIGNTYGGTVNSTFKLPDYRSKKLMGTGYLNGTIQSGASLTPNIGPSGGTADILVAGSEGGQYIVNTVRQLPPTSEITPGGPTKPDVFFDVGGTVLGRPIEFVSGSAYQNYGTGIGETGGFLEPPTTNGGRYIGLGTTGTSPFNSTQYTREVRITNLDLTGYSSVRIFSIAGNENNGGERVNNAGEGLRVIWPDGSESDILPSAIDVGGLEIFDPAYTSWVEIAIDIPFAYRTTGVTIRFRQDLDPSTNNPPGQEGSHNTTDPNAYDMIGIQKIGFLGGEIGGDADDTFDIGTYRTNGFSLVSDVLSANFTGNISYSAGPVNTKTLSGAAPHTHEFSYAVASGGTAAQGDGNNFCSGKSVAFYSNQQGNIRSFNREGRQLKSHSHLIYWESEANQQYASYGNDNTSGNSGLVNVTQTNNTSAFSQSTSSTGNRGETINKTLSVETIGVSVNDGIVTLRDSSRNDWDDALNVRLEAAEELSLMNKYYRLKYIIKVY